MPYTYISVLVTDACLYLFYFGFLVFSERRSWLGAFRPVIFRLSSLFLALRFFLSLVLSVRVYAWLVFIGNAMFVGLWLFAFRSLSLLIRRPDIRSVQVWVLPRRVEIVAIYKTLQGSCDLRSSLRSPCSSTCAICLQSLVPNSADRRLTALGILRRNFHTSFALKSHGVVPVLTTPCGHSHSIRRLSLSLILLSRPSRLPRHHDSPPTLFPTTAAAPTAATPLLSALCKDTRLSKDRDTAGTGCQVNEENDDSAAHASCEVLVLGFLFT